MGKEWIAVADRNRCRIFEQSSRHGQLDEVCDLVSPMARLKNQDIKADRPGAFFDAPGQGRHAASASVEPTEQEAIRFAKDVAGELDRGRTQHRFERLYLIAEPRFLGYLRQSLSRPLKETVAAEIDKDWTPLTAEEIRQRLREALFG